MRDDAKTDWAALSSLLGSMLVWGLVPVAVKSLLPYFSSTSLNAWRLLVASVLFALTTWLARRWPTLTAKEYLLLGLVGFLGTTGFQFTFVNGIANSTAAVSSLVSAINPLWVALIAVALGERLHARRWLGILLSIAGMFAIGLKTLDPQSGVSVVGLAWLLASSIVWAFYTVLQRPWLRRLTPLQFNAVAYGLGSLPYVVLGAPLALEPQTLQAPLTAWLGLLAIAVTGQFLGIFGWSKGVAAFGPTRTAVFLNLLPIFGLLAAVILLGERPSSLALVATAITLSGVYLTNSK